MSTSLDGVVERVAQAAHVDREVVERELIAGLERMAAELARPAIPAGDAGALEAIDTPAGDDDAVLAYQPWLRGELAWHQMVATAVRLVEAAARLGVSDSAVRHVVGRRPGDGGLLGVRDARQRWRIFAYQLPDADGAGGEPGSVEGRRVQQALPPRMHPVAVAAWWDAPHPGLLVDGHELSPRRWLACGYDPDQLVAAAESEDAT